MLGGGGDNNGGSPDVPQILDVARGVFDAVTGGQGNRGSSNNRQGEGNDI